MAKMGRPIIHKHTAFARWMKREGLTNAAAANVLDVSETQIKNLRRGHNHKGEVVAPSLVTRYAMAAITAGLKPHAG